MAVPRQAIAYVLIWRTTFGFSVRVAGGNVRAAKMAGLANLSGNPGSPDESTY